ncbi:MAG: hypothetical protein JNK57_17455 [Planctomycetaceae bacterium]|nr:hypothetical protein [Planctomycetaceae bacterium]
MVLAPLPFHLQLTEFLREQDPEIWSWFRQDATRSESSEALKFELLKTTYRVDQETQVDLYATAATVAGKLGLDLPLTIYQAHHSEGLNASLAYIPGELHVVLHGPIAEQLNPVEQESLFGHELTHYRLWDLTDGDILVADRLLAALTFDRSAHAAHWASLRLLRLYNEILCDRGAYQVTEDVEAVVSLLLKLETGVRQVNPAAFLKQADEIFQRGSISSQEVDHPELFIRARAIRLWSELDTKANAPIAEMIEGQPGLDNLDLLGQRQVAQATRQLLEVLFSYPWYCTDATLAHARLFFPDFQPPTIEKSPTNSRSLANWPGRIFPDSMADYYGYVLLDFMVADRNLEESALALGLTLAEQIGIKERFVEMLRKEFKLRKNQVDRIDRDKVQLLVAAQEHGAET